MRAWCAVQGWRLSCSVRLPFDRGPLDQSQARRHRPNSEVATVTRSPRRRGRAAWVAWLVPELLPFVDSLLAIGLLEILLAGPRLSHHAGFWLRSMRCVDSTNEDRHHN